MRMTAASFVALALTAGAAGADDLDRLKLRLNGHVSLVGAYVDQSTMTGLDEVALAVDTGLYGTAVLPLDGGSQIGARIAVDVDYATNFDSFLNDAGSSDVVEELWLYWEGGIGRIQLGLMDGAADILGQTVPTVSRSIRVDNPEVFLLGFPCDPSNICSSDPGFPGSLFSPNGMQLRSDLHGSDDYLKIMYMTPNFGGFRFAVSFAPDGTRDPGQLFGDDEISEQKNVLDVAVSYVTTFGEVDLGLSAGYVTGELVNEPFFLNELGDLEEWGGAARLGYREWSLGAAYRRTNIAGGGPVVQGFAANVFDDTYTEIWSVGLMYERGPWSASANYITANEEIVSNSDQEGMGLQFAAGYTFNENVRVTGGYQHYEFRREFGGGCGVFFFCDTLDGNVGYLETTFSF